MSMIGEDELGAAVRAQAAAHPDRTYAPLEGRRDVTRCSYLPNEVNPFGCIVGEALLSLGVPRRELEAIRNAGDWANDPDLRDALQTRLTTGALRSVWVAYVQHYQDDGHTWADAVKLADRRTEVEA